MIGLCTVTFRELSVKDILHLAEKNQLEAIEWGGDVHLPPGDFETAEQIRKESEKIGIKYTSYGSYYFLQDSQNFHEVLKTAKALGAKTIRVWAGKKDSKEADNSYMKSLIQEAREIADLAAKEKIKIAFEYHSGTLTDTPEAAYRLINKINHPNLSLYWQPSEQLSVLERQESLKKLLPIISNVHVFHWKDFYNRYSLKQGETEWKSYLKLLQNKDRVYYFEFVKNDSVDQFISDLKTLRDWSE